MKRSVAIVGPTPAFLSWAIQYACPLRDPVEQRVPRSTFRQLRGLRELSLAQIENRVVHGVCLHPDATFASPEQALGFSAAEIADPFGGLEFATACCRDCPANAGAHRQAKLLAGCYGWLPVDLRTDFAEVVRGRVITNAPLPLEAPSIVELLEQAKLDLAGTILPEQGFLATSPVWYGLWSRSPIPPNSGSSLAQLFSILLSIIETMPALSSRDLIGFLDALNQCQENQLELHVELVPSGYSDGTTWTLNSHCRLCKHESAAPPNNSVCPCCGQSGTWQHGLKSKVLGLRPYMNLQSIYGAAETNRILSAADQKKSDV